MARKRFTAEQIIIKLRAVWPELGSVRDDYGSQLMYHGQTGSYPVDEAASA
jgi:hypothetical protein